MNYRVFTHATLTFPLLSHLRVKMPNPVLSRGGARNTPQSLHGHGHGTPLQHVATHMSHITTVGVRRPGFGKAGKPMQVTANLFKTTMPNRVIYHYDGLSSCIYTFSHWILV